MQWTETTPLSPENLNDLESRIATAEQNVVDGKGTIAAAISAMNQPATGSDTHGQLASKIRDISKDANAAVDDTIAGRTFYQGGVKRTGTLALTGNAADSDVIAGRTFYTTNPKTKRTGTLALTGNASAGQVLSGRTYYDTDAKAKRTGTMPNRGAGGTVTPSTSNQSKAAGYYSSAITILGDPDLIAPNIVAPFDIFGVKGTALASATGQVATNGNASRTISGLPFSPTHVYAYEYRFSNPYFSYWIFIAGGAAVFDFMRIEASSSTSGNRDGTVSFMPTRSVDLRTGGFTVNNLSGISDTTLFWTAWRE